jgi:hypothetical protein
MIRIRCDATRGIHACSLWLDWTGQHPGDHRAHPAHDLSRPVLSTWPNLGVRSTGVPVHVPPAGASGQSTPPSPSTSAHGPSSSGQGSTAPGQGASGSASRPSPIVGPGAAPRAAGAPPSRTPLPGSTPPKPSQPQPRAAPPPAPAAPARQPRWYEYEVTEWDLLPDA